VLPFVLEDTIFGLTVTVVLECVLWRWGTKRCIHSSSQTKGVFEF